MRGFTRSPSSGVTRPGTFAGLVEIPYLHERGHERGVNTVEFLPVWEFEEVESGRDAAGLYQVGSFTTGRRWAEWNGKFRDDLRRFVKSDPGMVRTLANRLAGSPDLW